MTESISQGIPFINLGEHGIKLIKCNDISFSNLKTTGLDCLQSSKKPDQLVVHGSNILIGIEDKADSKDIDSAIIQLKDNYLPALPNTNLFIARAGETVKVFFRISDTQLSEIGTSLKGRSALCFGPKIITGENPDVQERLTLLADQVLRSKVPINGSFEIQPPKDYYNPLIVKQSVIYSLWQKIFVSTGENAHICLSTFVELLLYKGLSDAKMLPKDFSIETLADPQRTQSLNTYKTSVRHYIKTTLFPTPTNQPGVINGFAFEEQETVFKKVLQDLCDLGNLSQRQIDPDFKRRIIEAFLGSAHKEGTIKNGKHLTPRIIIQAIWEMANPAEGKIIVDPACGVGGFVLEGLNYPYEFDPMTFKCFGIDRDDQMIITAKANMIMHVLDKFADPEINKVELANRINTTFYQAKNNGTGTLAEIDNTPEAGSQFIAKYKADYVFSNVPFYVNGVSQIDNSLQDLGLKDFYLSCGIGIESRFIKYILGQIKFGDPGIAFVIITDGILYRHKDSVRSVINNNSDVLGIISLPKGIFQNNSWKTSILIFKKKSDTPEYAPVFLYNLENIGISLDSYRTPIEENNIPGMKKAWEMRFSGSIDDPNCRLVDRHEFLQTERWSELFSWCRTYENEDAVSFSEFIESATILNNQIHSQLDESDQKLGDIFSLENYIEVKLGDANYLATYTPSYTTTIKHARMNPGEYPVFSSQVDGPVAHMYDPDYPPNMIKNETEDQQRKIISWNIKGAPCKDIRVHTSPFYTTENKGLIYIIDENIDFDYLLYYLREHLIKAGDFSRSNEAHAGKVKNISIRLPIDDRGNIDLEKQRLIATNYESIMDLKNGIRHQIQELEKLIANIDVFR